MGPCPGTRGHLCCSYRTIDLYLGCTIGCTYCIMQTYLNYSPLTVYADTGPAVEGIEADAAATRDQPLLRIGTGEVGDSLLLDPVFRLSRRLVEVAARFPHVRLELKTKTDHVDHLLDIPDKGGAVIGFSLSPRATAGVEEPFAASIPARIAAASRAAEAGFGIAYHFDPVITGPGKPYTDWKDGYRELVDALPPLEPAWVSMGTIRFPSGVPGGAPSRPYLYDELIRSRDGKARYLQKRRVEVYRTLLELVRRRFRAPVYLCMESAAVWKRVFGGLPGDLPGVRDIFQRASLASGGEVQ